MDGLQGWSSGLKYWFFLYRWCPSDYVGLAPSSDPVINQLNTLISGYGNYYTKLFNTESELEPYIQNQNYSGLPQICFAITVQSSSSNIYQYKIRFNSSTNDGPDPSLKLTGDKGIDLVTYASTMWQGMIGANTLVGTAILQLQSGLGTEYFKNNVSPMYQ